MHRKRCPACKRRKNRGSFRPCITRKDGLQPYCIGCDKKKQTTWYSTNSVRERSKIKLRKKLSLEISRQFLFEYLTSHPCVDCGESNIVVLEFDHLGNKELGISAAIRSGWRVRRLQKEIAKCEVRCANCHKRKTAQQFRWWKSDNARMAERL